MGIAAGYISHTVLHTKRQQLFYLIVTDKHIFFFFENEADKSPHPGGAVRWHTSITPVFWITIHYCIWRGFTHSYTQVGYTVCGR